MAIFRTSSYMGMDRTFFSLIYCVDLDDGAFFKTKTAKSNFAFIASDGIALFVSILKGSTATRRNGIENGFESFIYFSDFFFEKDSASIR